MVWHLENPRDAGSLGGSRGQVPAKESWQLRGNFKQSWHDPRNKKQGVEGAGPHDRGQVSTEYRHSLLVQALSDHLPESEQVLAVATDKRL